MSFKHCIIFVVSFHLIFSVFQAKCDVNVKVKMSAVLYNSATFNCTDKNNKSLHVTANVKNQESFTFLCKKPLFRHGECWCNVKWIENVENRFLAYHSKRHEELKGLNGEYVMVYVTPFGARVNGMFENFE